MWLVCLLASFAFLVAIHHALGRVLPDRGALLRLIVAFIPSALLLWWATYSLGYSILSYGAFFWLSFLSALYIFAFTLSQSSISVKLIGLLQEGPLDRASIERLYSPSYMVERRIERLFATELATREGGDLKLTQRGSFLVSCYRLARRLLHG